MKCTDIEKELALAAANCLEASRLPQIREHCRHCPGCAAHWQEFLLISSAHTHAAAELDALPLHFRRTADRVRQRAGHPNRRTLDSTRIWRLSLGTLAAVITAFLFFRELIRPPVPIRVRPAVTSTLPIQANPVSSIAAYRNAIEKSGEASFDALLARDADRLLRGTIDRDLRSLRGEFF